MRQLLATGWMPNRGRLVVASFLTRHLLIDHRVGEDHFMAHLVDGDLANDNGGWQWTAGVGTDAQPWFRIFDPVRQGTRFDPDGSYVRRWVPELADVPTEHIHAPWLAPGWAAAGISGHHRGPALGTGAGARGLQGGVGALERRDRTTG